MIVDYILKEHGKTVMILINNQQKKERTDAMKKLCLIFLLIGSSITVMAQMTETIFHDKFDNSVMRSDLWHIPTWVSSTDGTYVGRTQFRCSQNAALPEIINGEAVIKLETYNPTGYSFYGTDLITNRTFSMGDGLIFTIEARFKSPVPGGIVGGIFLYDLVGTGPSHDEIDFELVSNRPYEIQTNIYDNEPLGAGHPSFSSFTDPVTDNHTYVIRWFPGKVTWLVDGIVIRTTETLVPERPMHFHLNIWAPDAGWAEAFDNNLQPVANPVLNMAYSMLVSSVRVDSVVSEIISTELINEDPGLRFYPNPAHDFIRFDNSGKIDLSIYNLNGDLILSRHDMTGDILPVRDLVPGVYFIKYRQNSFCKYSKLIKH